MKKLVNLAGRGFCTLLCGFGLLFSSGFESFATQSVTLAWDPSPGTDIAGYFVYYSKVSGSYTAKVSAGLSTNAVVTGLSEGTTYYFVATAINTSGLESDPSNEVLYNVPAAPPNQPPTLDFLSNLVIDENAPQQVINLTGITAGATNENQALTVTASSSDPALIPDPVVAYTSPSRSGSMTFAPAPQSSGSATLTVTVSDGQATSGTISRSFSVTVQALGALPPVVTTQPISQNVVAGVDVTFAVAAAGTPPFTYQWRKNGAALPGVTQSSLTLNKVSPGQQGNYSVVVSNRGGSATSANASLTVQAVDVQELLAGTYNGLFFEPDAVSQLSSGSLTLKTTAKRTFSGTLQNGSKRFSLSGLFDSQGNAVKTIARKNQNPLTVTLQVDPNDQDRLTGTVSDGSFTAELKADRAVFDGRQRLAPQIGQYTVVIPGAEDSTSTPRGSSYGTVSVDKAGRVRFAASLADGTKFSRTVTLSKNGDWPLYVSLYSGQGSILSRLTFTTTSQSDLSGDVVWIKPSVPQAKLYPAGFGFETTATGYRYTRPAIGQNVLGLTETTLSLTGGSLAQTLSTPLVVDPRSRVTDIYSRRFSLTFSISSGLFSGKVLNPATMKNISFRGVVMQSLNSGAGYFLDVGQSGTVTLGTP